MGRPLPLKTLALAGGAAVGVALLASLALVPPLAVFVIFLLLPAPLLIAWVYLAADQNWAYSSATLAVLLAFAVGGGAIAAFAFVCALGGLGLGAAVSGRAKPLLAGVMVTAAMISGTMLVLAALKLALGVDILDPLRQAVTEMGRGWTGPLFTSGDQAPPARLADQFIYLFPASLVLFYSGAALGIYVLARWTLGRRYEVAPLQPFAEWRLPRWVPWLFLPGILLWLMGMRPDLRGATRVGDNLMQVLNMLFEVQGLAVVFWWLRKRMGRLMSGIITAIPGFVPPLAMVLMFLGIWDALFDFRKLEPRRER